MKKKTYDKVLECFAKQQWIVNVSWLVPCLTFRYSPWIHCSISDNVALVLWQADMLCWGCSEAKTILKMSRMFFFTQGFCGLVWGRHRHFVETAHSAAAWTGPLGLLPLWPSSLDSRHTHNHAHTADSVDGRCPHCEPVYKKNPGEFLFCECQHCSVLGQLN